jgi:hypothetical protein
MRQLPSSPSPLDHCSETRRRRLAGSDVDERDLELAVRSYFCASELKSLSPASHWQISTWADRVNGNHSTSSRHHLHPAGGHVRWQLPPFSWHGSSLLPEQQPGHSVLLATFDIVYHLSHTFTPMSSIVAHTTSRRLYKLRIRTFSNIYFNSASKHSATSHTVPSSNSATLLNLGGFIVQVPIILCPIIRL